jgi:hypothetical protein
VTRRGEADALVRLPGKSRAVARSKSHAEARQADEGIRLSSLVALILAGCATASLAIPAGWLDVPHAPQYPALSYDGGVLTYRLRTVRETGVHIVKTATGAKLANGDKDLTPEFRAIDSFDVSAERKEVVFSAKRDDNFDVGLVSIDGSDIHWVPNDPADEVSVQWAPRGAKISYIIRGRVGDVVRIVHVLTAAQFISDFPGGRVIARAWEANGERYAVSWESVDASQRIESMTYDGRERRMNVAPGAQLTGIATELTKGALIVRPELMQYGEKLPLVVWRTSDRNRWSDARGKLERENRVACAVIDHDPDTAFWDDMRQHPWIDMSRVFVVNAPAPSGATSIRGSAAVESGRYRIDGNTMLAPVDVVESFAAGTIAHQLKGSPPANGRNR